MSELRFMGENIELDKTIIGECTAIKCAACVYKMVCNLDNIVASKKEH